MNIIFFFFMAGILTAFIFVLLGCILERLDIKKMRYTNMNIRLEKCLWTAKAKYYNCKRER